LVPEILHLHFLVQLVVHILLVEIFEFEGGLPLSHDCRSRLVGDEYEVVGADVLVNYAKVYYKLHIGHYFLAKEALQVWMSKLCDIIVQQSEELMQRQTFIMILCNEEL
jgi:hypothetical protein